MWAGETEDVVALVRGVYRIAREKRSGPPAESVAALERFVSTTPGLSETDRAISAFVLRLTLDPSSMRASRLDELRSHGLDEQAIHDVVNVACCFAYMNRLADGTGVTLLESAHDWARELFGEEELERHLAWSRGEQG